LAPKKLAFAGRCAKMRAWFFSVNLRSKSGAPPVGAPKQFLIWNHFIVMWGKYYDPSYGHGPLNTLEEWESASIDGYFKEFNTNIGVVTIAKTNSPDWEIHCTPAAY
jgi:hypothetical protein